MATTSEDLLFVKALSVRFNKGRETVYAVNDLTFSMKRGELLAMVGESGCGKTVTCLSILRLNGQANTQGEILFCGEDVLQMGERDLRSLRGGRIAMVFQNPSSALNPVTTIGTQLTEVIRHHRRVSPQEARAIAVEALRELSVPSPEHKLQEYPHQQSGGTNQRIMIAMALSCNPDLLLADEPTASLDATVQKQILGVFDRLKKTRQMGFLFVTHNLGVVFEIADRVMILYQGMLMEEGKTQDIFANPLNPYTKALLSTVPFHGKHDITIAGEPPSPFVLPQGCPYAERCQERIGDVCWQDRPRIVGQRRKVRCHWYDETVMGTGARKCADNG